MAFGSESPIPRPPSYRSGCLAFAILSAVLACVIGLLYYTESRGRVAAETAGQQLLQDQQTAWNRGDLASFTATYRLHESIAFTSEGRTYQGWDQLNERYRMMYSGRQLGTLKYDDTVVEPLASDAVIMRGRWTLNINASQRMGFFTILAKKFPAPEGWKIVHDHQTIGGQ